MMKDEKPLILPGWERTVQEDRDIVGRFRGCLLGGAVGDALGAPVEFMTRQQIIAEFGPDGITDYAPAYGDPGSITDDTQMTLFTAEGLIRALPGWRTGGISHVLSAVGRAYQRWLLTQGDKSALTTEGDGWLFQMPRLHDQRAPGLTCLSALRQMKAFGEPADNNSKGCGGVMRVAPVGLMAGDRYGTVMESFELGCDIAALTHGHPTGILPAGVLAVLVRALVEGASLAEGLITAKAILRTKAHHEETLGAIEMAEALAGTDLPPHEAIAQLGEAWVAEEALAISLYCALVAQSFRHGVILSVNHDGDSDSTGAITGNILGAMHGERAIPPAWLESLELREVISEIAEDLHACWHWHTGKYSADPEFADQISHKYPGW